MPTFEPSPDLDPAVAKAIQDAMDAVRSEFIARDVPPAPPASANGAPDLGDLEAAVDRIDGATEQGEVLECLLEAAGRYAERTVFLVRKDQALTGWAAYGFTADPDTVTSLSLTGGPWGSLLGGGDTVALDAADCDQLSAALGASPATGGLLVPFSLRGEVAGALYGDGEVDRSALRVLTYVAALALETLPVRRGEWEPAPVAPADDDIDIAVVDDDLDSDFTTAVTEPDVDEAVEDVMSRIEEVEGEATEDDLLSIHHEVQPERFGSIVDSFTQVEAEGLDQVVTEEIESIEREEAEQQPDFATQEFSTVADVAPPIEPAPVDAPIDEPPPMDAPAPPVEPPADRAPEQGEVAPPTDLDGPGWAFGDSPQQAGDDSEHEEARRLARLLVTEIKLYNEEKVRAGREGKNLYDTLREDIERSERIYQERIDAGVRDSTDYFNEELVRILAGGDSTVLGN